MSFVGVGDGTHLWTAISHRQIFCYFVLEIFLKEVQCPQFCIFGTDWNIYFSSKFDGFFSFRIDCAESLLNIVIEFLPSLFDLWYALDLWSGFELLVLICQIHHRFLMQIVHFQIKKSSLNNSVPSQRHIRMCNAIYINNSCGICIFFKYLLHKNCMSMFVHVHHKTNIIHALHAWQMKFVHGKKNPIMNIIEFLFVTTYLYINFIN